MIQLIEAINNDEAKFERSIFLAGGITGCPDWQQEVIEAVKHLDITVYNPRRKDFPIDDPSAAEAQINWEFSKLRKADCVSFWFCRETLCPITLFELGATMERMGRCIIGVHPEYKHRQSVEIQARRKDHFVLHSLLDLTERIKHEMTREYIF